MHAKTRRQREVLEIITRYVGHHGYNPSYQQIAKHLGLKSRSGIARIVGELQAQGLIARSSDDGQFEIHAETGPAGAVVPWLVIPGVDINDPAASRPLSLPSFVIGDHDPESLRAFRVRDAAMAPAIELDDVLLVERREHYREGHIVVAVVSGKQAFARRYYRVGAYIELADANGNRTRVPADNVEIVGVFRGLLRPAA